MFNHLEERCGDCYFWIHSDLLELESGDCCRFPRREPKSRNDGCGEFKAKKRMHYLTEEKKNETDS